MNKALCMIGVVMSIMIAGCTPALAAKPKTAETLAIEMIAKYEGFSAKVYTCAGGVKTIGYGFTEPRLVNKGSITRAEADKELGIVVRKELKWLDERVTGLNDKQRAACVSFIFNLGRGNFLKSTMFKNLKDKKFTEAAAECNKWIYCNGKVLNGLVKRRAAESSYLKA